MNKDTILNIKIDVEDYLLMKTCILDSIRKYKNDLSNNYVDEEAKKIIEKTLNLLKVLLKKLEVCELYNEDYFNETIKNKKEIGIYE